MWKLWVQSTPLKKLAVVVYAYNPHTRKWRKADQKLKVILNYIVSGQPELLETLSPKFTKKSYLQGGRNKEGDLSEGLQPLTGMQTVQPLSQISARRLHRMFNLEGELKEVGPESNPEPLLCGCPHWEQRLRSLVA